MENIASLSVYPSPIPVIDCAFNYNSEALYRIAGLHKATLGEIEKNQIHRRICKKKQYH